MKNLLVLSILLTVIIMPAVGEEFLPVNQNTMRSFSGTYEIPRSKYPPLSAAEEVMKADSEENSELKSKMDRITAPMNMSPFTQNYDSSNNMMRMRNLMPNMMGF